MDIFVYISTAFFIINNVYSQQILNYKQIHYLSSLSNETYTNEVLKHLLVPRVVGTQGHKNVATYISKELQSLGYEIEIDEFSAKTPNFGVLTFRNIVARLNPKAKKFLVLACHYDSKYFKEFEFIGATDSAVPCAMMLNLAKTLKTELNYAKSKTDVSLKFIFFDGEEAFHQWGPNDSIYGAKHLAKKWEAGLRVDAYGATSTHLESIDLLVLLDLLGAQNPRIYSFFEQTRNWYSRLANAEKQLKSLGLLSGHKQKYFANLSQHSFIEDDHVPFYQRGVNILHIIPTPFPMVWHLEGDNARAVHLDTVENLLKIFRIFIAEFLNLSVLPIQ